MTKSNLGRAWHISSTYDQRAEVSTFTKRVAADGRVTAIEASDNVMAYNLYTSKYWANWRIKLFSIKKRSVIEAQCMWKIHLKEAT